MERRRRLPTADGVREKHGSRLVAGKKTKNPRRIKEYDMLLEVLGEFKVTQCSRRSLREREEREK